MLGCDDLEEAEHAHIIRCALCAQKMAESVLEEMEDHPPMTKEKAQSSTSSE
jgi:hypothetical protein